jgi:hypothetical protein
MLFAGHLKRRKVATQVDGIAATACCLPAYRAITKIERVRMFRLELELDLPAMTGSL